MKLWSGFEPGQVASSANEVMKYMNSQAGNAYAQAKGFPSIPALEVGTQIDARDQGLEQRKSAMEDADTNRVLRGADVASTLGDPNLAAQLMRQYLQRMGLSSPTAQ